MKSATGAGAPTAFFSFSIKCTGSASSGALTYSDLAAGVLIRATPTFCNSTGSNSVALSGTYRVLGSGATGTFSATGTGGIAPPPGTASLCLHLMTGPLAGYNNCGPVLAGRLSMVP